MLSALFTVVLAFYIVFAWQSGADIAGAADNGACSSPPIGPPCSYDETRWGWTAGGGLEWGFAPNWSAKLEWLYMKFDSAPLNTLGLAEGNRSSVPLDDNVVRAGAMTLSPQLGNTGAWLLKQIDDRARTTVAGSVPDVVQDPPLNLQHYAKNPQGWMVTETTHFRIFHNQTTQYAENVAQVAEATRTQMLRKWFGKEGEDWTPKCDIYLYANAGEYSQTGTSGASPTAGRRCHSVP